MFDAGMNENECDDWTERERERWVPIDGDRIRRDERETSTRLHNSSETKPRNSGSEHAAQWQTRCSPGRSVEQRHRKSSNDKRLGSRDDVALVTVGREVYRVVFARFHSAHV